MGDYQTRSLKHSTLKLCAWDEGRSSVQQGTRGYWQGGSLSVVRDKVQNEPFRLDETNALFFTGQLKSMVGAIIPLQGTR